MGVKYFGSIETAVLTPMAAPAREKAKSFETISTFIFFAFQNLKALAKVERKADNLLVPMPYEVGNLRQNMQVKKLNLHHQK